MSGETHEKILKEEMEGRVPAQELGQDAPEGLARRIRLNFRILSLKFSIKFSIKFSGFYSSLKTFPSTNYAY